MNGFLLIAIGVGVLGAFGLFSKLYGWAKSLYTATTGKSVDTSLDSQITKWLTEAKSAKVQGLLRMCRLEFKAIDDIDSVAAINSLIQEAAAWDDPITVTETAATTATVTTIAQ